MFEQIDTAEFDRRAFAADEVLRKARAREQQADEGGWITHYLNVIDARIESALATKMQRLIDQKIEQALDAVINDVGDVIGELLKEIDSDIHGLISRLTSMEVAAKHRNDAVITDIVVQMKQIGDTLADVSSKIDAARSGENVVALRKIN